MNRIVCIVSYMSSAADRSHPDMSDSVEGLQVNSVRHERARI
jgi:hypothetical protein